MKYRHSQFADRQPVCSDIPNFSWNLTCCDRYCVPDHTRPEQMCYDLFSPHVKFLIQPILQFKCLQLCGRELLIACTAESAHPKLRVWSNFVSLVHVICLTCLKAKPWVGGTPPQVKNRTPQVKNRTPQIKKRLHFKSLICTKSAVIL